MKTIKLLFLSSLLLLSAAWLLADTMFPDPLTYFTFRKGFIQYSGVIAIGVMSFSMLLAIRPKWLEPRVHGLDKMYRLHKWLGIAGLVFAILHWWFIKGTKWMVNWGWLERPASRSHSGQSLSMAEDWIRTLHGPAEWLGKWAFYAVVILIILALVKKFPYHLFKKTHKWLAMAYLFLVFHSVVLLKPQYWLQPVGWLMMLLMLCGTISAVTVLMGRIGFKRKVRGKIKSLEYYPGVHVIEGAIQLEEGWPGHTPGQFAFVTAKSSEGAHPYTIASPWDPNERTLTFIVKELGDWTSQLRNRLEVGLSITVEGPYGCFDFRCDHPQQIWVAGGIGVTPFIAQMKHLARQPGKQKVDLFHTSANYDETAMAKLTADAKAAGIKLHLHNSVDEGTLTPDTIRDAVPKWRQSSIWFCGPTAFGKALRKDLVEHGLAVDDYHQELFEMR